MKAICVNELEPGMIVANDIYNEKEQCLIKRGVELTVSLIERIKCTDYDRIFISDNYDDVEDYLGEVIKIRAIRCLKSFYADATINNKNKLDEKKYENFKYVVGDVVDEITKNKNCLVQLSNLKNFSNNIYEHGIDVARVSVLIGVNMGLKKEKLTYLCLSAMLHDIGMTLLSQDLLNKTTKYNTEEIEEMTKHSKIGYDLMKNMGIFNSQCAKPVLQHHERFDGKGYPEGVKGDKIDILARIISIADVYCTMRTGTSNTPAYIQNEVREYMYADSSRQFDPDILEIFLKKVPLYDIGQIIKLSNFKEAVVVRNNENAIARPVVKILNGDMITNEEIDLLENVNITILN